jgi:small ligand-binding sensory domain FIST
LREENEAWPAGRARAGAAVVGLEGHAPEPGAAAREAARAVRQGRGIGRPAALWLALGGGSVAASEADHAAAALEALQGIESVWPGAAQRTIVTRTAGLLATDGEWRAQAALGLLALEGPGITPFAVEELAGEEDRAGPEVAARLHRALDGEVEPGDAVVIWADAARLAVAPLLQSLAADLAPAQLVGGAVSPPSGEAPFLALGPRSRGAGVVGWHVARALEPRIEEAEAGHPLTPPLEVTRARGHWLLGIAGRPALDVFREAAGPALGRDLARAVRVLKVEMLDPGGPDPGSDPGAGILANVVGLDGGRRAFSVARPVASGRRVRIVQLDAECARSGLDGALGRLAAGPAPPGWALYFGCRGRGTPLFGVEGLEAGLLARGLGEAPWLGVAVDDPIAPGPRLLPFAGVVLAAG